MATVIVPASQPFMQHGQATKKNAIGSSAIRLDNHRLPAGSYRCCQGCMKALDWGRDVLHRGGGSPWSIIGPTNKRNHRTTRGADLTATRRSAYCDHTRRHIGPTK
jgi:hypothetical protein